MQLGLALRSRISRGGGGARLLQIVVLVREDDAW